jgi:hypothetical protein
LDLLEKHLLTYPHMNGEDIYKLLHQSVFGAAHLKYDEKKLKSCLLDELKTCSSKRFKNEKNYDVLTLSPLVLRFNLRPFKEKKGDFQKLFAILKESVTKKIGSEKDFLFLINRSIEYLNMKGKRQIALELKSILKNKEKFRDLIFHHSETYRELYKPSYRVLVLIRNLTGRNSNSIDNIFNTTTTG